MPPWNQHQRGSGRAHQHDTCRPALVEHGLQVGDAAASGPDESWASRCARLSVTLYCGERDRWGHPEAGTSERAVDQPSGTSRRPSYSAAGRH